MGLSESGLTKILSPCECLSHCKIAAKSPCCTFCCDDGCEILIDTHDYESESGSPSLSGTHQRSNFSLQ